MQTSEKPENDNMTLWHWLFVVAGIIFFYVTLSAFDILKILFMIVGALICSRLFMGRKRQFALCFLMGGGLIYMGMMVAMYFAGVTDGS